jgi:hypothetical protein
MPSPFEPDSSTVDKGETFTNGVAALYVALGYKVNTFTELSGKQTDILAEKYVAGAGTVRLAIECKYRSDGNVGNAEVFDFSKVLQLLIRSERITRGVLVTNNGFTKNAYEAAEADGHIELKTEANLEQDLLTLDEVFAEYVADYKQQAIFTQYVPLNAQVKHLEPGKMKKLETRRRVSDIESHLMRWMETSKGTFISVLADYGAGKTTLLRRLQYEIAKKYIERKTNLKPLFIPLKEFYNHSSLETLIQYSVRSSYRRDIPPSVFWRIAAEGQFVFLLDGFDEMGTQVDTQQRLAHFITLSPLLTLKSTAVLTCRPSYFVTEDEYEKAIAGIASRGIAPNTFVPSKTVSYQLRKRLFDDLKKHLHERLIDRKPPRSLEALDSRVVELDTFQPEQIDEFLAKFDLEYQQKCGLGWRSIKEFLLNIYDLTDLMQRPILLTMINETVLAGTLPVSAPSASIGPSSLYEAYTSTQLDIEWSKGDTRRLLTSGQRRSLAEAIALAMFDAGQLKITYEDLLATVRANEGVWQDLHNRLGTLTDEQIGTDIQICTFFSRDQKGVFAFTHKSFLEFFVAAYLKKLLLGNHGDTRFLKPLPKEILYFLGAFAIVEPNVREVLIRWYKHKDVSAPHSAFRRNIAGALFYSGPLHSRLHLEDTAVFDLDVSRVRFDKPGFARITFENVQWSRVDCEEASFREVQFVRCRLRQWNSHGGEQSVTFRDSEAEEGTIGSKCNWSGLHSTFRKIRFLDAKLVLNGELEFQDCRWEKGTIQISQTASVTLRIKSSHFTESTVTCDPASPSRTISIMGSTFEKCLVFGLQLSESELATCTFKECKGMVLIEDYPFDEFTFNGEKVQFPHKKQSLWRAKLLVIQKRAWSKEDIRKSLLRELQGELGDAFSALGAPLPEI